MPKPAKSKSGLPPTLPKPRNPVALQAKAGNAGPHDGGQPARQARRAAKRALWDLLSGRKKDDDPA